MAERTTAEERFAALAQEVGEPVRRYVVRRVPPDLVDDVVADVFLALWRRLDDLPPDAALPWTYGVARNCVANSRRSVRRQLALVEKVTRLDPPRRVEPGPDSGDDRLHAALAVLSDLDQELVRLWAWEGLAPREIATSLDLTANAVSIRLTRAKQKLAELLRKDHDAPGQEQGEGRAT